MSIFFGLIGTLALIAGIGLLKESKSALHEIEAGICFLIWAVFWAGAGVMREVSETKNIVRGALKEKAPEEGKKEE